jgi:hypothetical protein
MTDDTCTFRSVGQDGTIREIEITASQAMDTMQGRGFAYCPRDERILVDEDGRIVRRESVIPQQLGDAA